MGEINEDNYQNITSLFDNKFYLQNDFENSEKAMLMTLEDVDMEDIASKIYK